MNKGKTHLDMLHVIPSVSLSRYFINYKIFIFFILIFLSAIGFSQTHSQKLHSKKEFESFSGLPLSEKYGQVSAIKVVYDLRKKQLYFINSHSYSFHYRFCKEKLKNEVSLDYFNKVNYSNSPKKRFLLANINYFRSLNKYSLEISPTDVMPPEQILLLHQIIIQSSFIQQLPLLLNTTRLINLKNEFKSKIEVIHPSDIYKNLDYQAIGKHTKCGQLKFISNWEEEKQLLKPTDIAIINTTPLVLPKLSGILVTEFQTPLSHLSILAQNRKIPIAAYKKAFEDSSLLKLANKKRCIQVSADTFQILEYNSLNTVKRRPTYIKLKYNLKVDSVVAISDFKGRSYKYAGNKASNFAILHKLSQKNDFKVPESAFAIPFYFYNQHIQKSALQPLINKVSNHGKHMSEDSLKLILKKIRKQIRSTPVDSLLIACLNQKLSTSTYTRFRFRSSTNAEDAKGFSGAGLYTSKTGIIHDDKKTFEKAIQKVWASLWSYKAFSERQYFNINHKEVFMGILVHRSFPSEKVNGVAITKNVYRKSYTGFVVNAQLGDESVVNPKKGIIADQFVCYPKSNTPPYQYKNTIDVITVSNLNKGNLVTSESEIQHLANQLDIIKRYYYNLKMIPIPYFDFGLDLEFKLDKESRELYIKQVRPYNN